MILALASHSFSKNLDIGTVQDRRNDACNVIKNFLCGNTIAA